MNTDELDYDLPERLIAQEPAPERTASRLMVLHRTTGCIEHRRFRDVVEYLGVGDCLVINDSRVVPARFWVRRLTGGRIEGLFLHQDEQGVWEVLLKNAGRVRVGEVVTLTRADAETPARHLTLTVQGRSSAGTWYLEPHFTKPAATVLQECGVPPLPPYIRRRPGDLETARRDRQRYQTVYARYDGSVAAPTAGLHFSSALLEAVRARGVVIARLSLHVGWGTFRPVTSERLEEHVMHAERYRLEEDQAELINTTRAGGGRVVAVGTTTVRVLETLAEATGQVRPGEGWTDLFILPGYRFRVTGAMITNFHLPRSTLLALVCAFAGTREVLAAYRQAVEEGYRFYSYGDAMLIL